jgi:predicted ArsR family transcriptional regulator
VDRLDDDVPALAVLDDAVRRALYRHVVAQVEPVSRDAAGAAVGISRSLAAFHLDKLAAAGLLDVEFRRPVGRRGPGAGRPAKLYRRAERQLDVTIPPRRYELAARILAAAVHDATDGRPLTESLRDAARQAGASMAHGVRNRTRAVDVLSAFGYEPIADGATLLLRNCPFHALALEHTDLVCGVNADLLTSFCDAVPELGLHAELAPARGRCCVTLTKPARRS